MADEVSDLQAKIDALGFKWKAGWTSLSNLTEEELKKRLGLLEDKGYSNNFPFYSGPKSVLNQKLWNTTPIKDQDNCGSCWAFASVAALETLALESGFPINCLDLSEEFNVFQLKKQVHLIPGDYEISAILRSQPDSYLTIVISNRDISSFQDLP